MYQNKPHVFNKRLDRTLVAAETVLGPDAVKKIFNTVFEDIPDQLKALLNFIDPQKQIVIKTGEDIAGGIIIREEPRSAVITEDLEGYTLVDIKTAIAEAIRDDLTGFVLQALQLKWQRELTLDDAENITFHLNSLIHLIK